MHTRRAFLRGLSGLAFAAPSFAQAPPPENELCLFTKHLQGLGFDDIAGVAAEAGVSGIEAPIRPGGHIEPGRIEDDLPKLIQALEKQNLGLTILTSSITEVSPAQRTEAILRTAAKLGVKRFRMGYYKYDLKRPIWDQLQAVKPKIADLITLCGDIGIQPLFQNHSGNDYLGAAVWDIYSLMRDWPADRFALAFDIMHATCEGGRSWPLEFHLVKDRLGAVFFKDFKWEGRRLTPCPLGDGQVDPAFGRMLLETGWRGPISLHLEFLHGNPKDAAVLRKFRAAHAREVQTLKRWLGRE